MKKHYDEEICMACDFIRIFHLMQAAGAVREGKDNGNGVHDVVRALETGSEISVLISKHDWNTLFANHTWLSFLKGAQQFSILEPKLLKHLRVIMDNFPKETDPILFPNFQVNTPD